MDTELFGQIEEGRRAGEAFAYHTIFPQFCCLLATFAAATMTFLSLTDTRSERMFVELAGSTTLANKGFPVTPQFIKYVPHIVRHITRVLGPTRQNIAD